MYQRSWFCALLALGLLANAFCLPFSMPRLKRQATDSEKGDNATNQITNNDDDDDDFDEPISTSSGGGGGSNLFSLLNLATSILPASSGNNGILRKLLRQFISLNKPKLIIKRNIENDIEFDYINEIKPPTFLRQEESDDKSDNSNLTGDSGDSESSDDENTAQESIEDLETSKENSDSNDASVPDDNDDSDYDSDEPPGGGDGQGGGILGLLAGLSGGEDGQSDLGSLLAAVSGIIANLSGDGIDLNALIASGIGLFAGLLSEGDENPGAVIASYLLTSLDTITGGGSKNNGAFFGKFLSKLIKGTSAGGDPDASSEENGEVMKDSAGFYGSFLMSLLGDMSKGSSGSHPWR